MTLKSRSRMKKRYGIGLTTVLGLLAYSAYRGCAPRPFIESPTIVPSNHLLPGIETASPAAEPNRVPPSTERRQEERGPLKSSDEQLTAEPHSLTVQGVSSPESILSDSPLPAPVRVILPKKFRRMIDLPYQTRVMANCYASGAIEGPVRSVRMTLVAEESASASVWNISEGGSQLIWQDPTGAEHVFHGAELRRRLFREEFDSNAYYVKLNPGGNWIQFLVLASSEGRVHYDFQVLPEPQSPDQPVVPLGHGRMVNSEPRICD